MDENENQNAQTDTSEAYDSSVLADSNSNDILQGQRNQAQKFYENCALNMYKFLESSVEYTDQILAKILEIAEAKAKLALSGIDIFAVTPEPVPTVVAYDDNSGITADAENAIANGLQNGGGGGSFGEPAISASNKVTMGAFGENTNAIAAQAYKEAIMLGTMYDINSVLIYGQWYHETGGFTSDLMKEAWNLGGITQEEPNDLPQPDGSLYYMRFSSLHEYAAYFGRHWLDDAEIKGTQDAETYCRYLKKYSYFGDDFNVYLNGVISGAQNLPRI